MIFYFSGTGNTRWVANQIAEAIGEELFFIPQLIKEKRYQFELREKERIGFCFPTHGWQPPRIVREFVSRLVLKGLHHHFCWALTTCGDNMGEAMTIFNKELASNEALRAEDGSPLQAESVFSVIMPESYVCLPFMKTDPINKEQQKIANAKDQLRHTVSSIRDCQRGIEELEKGGTPQLYSYVIGAYFNRKMITDKKFTVDKDVCIQCGKCSKVCPVDNIVGIPPTWQHNGQCTCCMACYHYCPVHAINYGSITRQRDQYYFNRRGDQK